MTRSVCRNMGSAPGFPVYAVWILLVTASIAFGASTSTAQPQPSSTTPSVSSVAELPTAGEAANGVAGEPDREPSHAEQVHRGLLEDTRFHYLLSAIAQALASIMTLIFTVTLVVAQLTTSYGLHLAESAFGWRNLLKMGVFIAAMMVAFAGLYHPGQVMGGISFALTLVCMVVLLFHFRSMRSQLNVVKHVDKTEDRAKRQTKKGNIDAAKKEVDRLETVAYQALGRDDYLVAGAAVKSMALIIGPMLERGLVDHALEVRDIIKVMALDKRTRPKAVSVVLGAFAKGVAEAGGHTVGQFHKQVADVLRAFLRACDWPREEETVAVAFEAVGLFLDRLPDIDCDRAGIATYVMKRLADERKDLVKPDPCGPFVHGSGRASSTLHAVYAHLARRSTKQRPPDARLINSAVEYSLKLMADGDAAFGVNEGLVFHRTTKTLIATAPHLDPDIVRSSIAAVRLNYGGYPHRAMLHWWEVVVAMLQHKKDPLVVVAMEKLTDALKAIQHKEQSSEATEVLFLLAGNAEQLVQALGHAAHEKLSRVLTVAREKRKQGALSQDVLLQVVLALSHTSRCIAGETWLCNALFSTANGLVDDLSRQDDKNNQTYPISGEPAYCWFVTAAILLRWHTRENQGSANVNVLNELHDGQPKHAALKRESETTWRRATKEFKESAGILASLREVYEKLGIAVPSVSVTGEDSA